MTKRETDVFDSAQENVIIGTPTADDPDGVWIRTEADKKCGEVWLSQDQLIRLIEVMGGYVLNQGGVEVKWPEEK